MKIVAIQHGFTQFAGYTADGLNMFIDAIQHCEANKRGVHNQLQK